METKSRRVRKVRLVSSYANFPVIFNCIFGVIGTKVTNKLILSKT